MVLAHNIVDVSRTEDVKTTQNITFDRMLLSKKTLEGLKLAGFVKPSPIQLHGIPLGKCGFDLIVEAKSGTGKTAVFSVIALEKLVLDNGLQVIILAPTREIAAQICDVIKDIGSKYEGLVVEVTMGGLPFAEDVAKFKRRKVHVVVSSPGRLHYLIKGNHVDTSSVRLIVFDEADKLLLDKCFAPNIKYILSKLPQHKQIIMSSATYPESTKFIINQYMKNSQHVCPESSGVLIGIDHRVTFVKSHCNIVNQTRIKYAELLSILTKRKFKQCLIFCNYQVRVSEIYKWLIADNWPVEHLYGAQDQGHRLDSLRTLKEFKCRILIATDLAARGIDASNVDLVISFEPPYEWTTYLHRIGRAGRYGSFGTAVTILSLGTEVTKFQNLVNSIVVESGSLVIKNLWNNKIWNFADDDVNKTICDNDINSKVITKEQSSTGEHNGTVKLNDLLGMNKKNEIEINNFNSFLSSFENDDKDDKNQENNQFNTIKLANMNVKGVLEKSSPDNTLFEGGVIINNGNSIEGINLNNSSFIIKDLQNGEACNFSDDGNKLREGDESRIKQYKSTEDLNNTLRMNRESKIEINDFDSFLSSFENEDDYYKNKREANGQFNTIKLENVDVKGILEKLKSDNTVFTDCCVPINNNFIEQIEPSNPITINSSISSDNEENDLMVKLGLPTSFGNQSRHNKKTKRCNKKYTVEPNSHNKILNKQTDKPETSSKSQEYHVRNNIYNHNIDDDSDSSLSEYCSIGNEYNKENRHKHFSNNHRLKQSKKLSSEESYFQWYNQLKHNMRQLEQIVYIQEMSK